MGPRPICFNISKSLYYPSPIFFGGFCDLKQLNKSNWPKATVPSTQSQIILASICTAQYAAKYVARSFWPELVRGNSTPSGGVLPISDSTVRYGTVPYDTVLYGTVLYCVNTVLYRTVGVIRTLNLRFYGSIKTDLRYSTSRGHLRLGVESYKF